MDTPPFFDVSNVHGALSANVIKTAEVCFLSAAQDVMKEAIYLDNMVFETNLRLINLFLTIFCINVPARPMKTACIKV